MEWDQNKQKQPCMGSRNLSLSSRSSYFLPKPSLPLLQIRNKKNLLCRFVKNRCNNVYENALSTGTGWAMFGIIGLRNQESGLSKAAALLPKLTNSTWCYNPNTSGICLLLQTCGHHLLVKLPFLLLDKWNRSLMDLMISGLTFLNPESSF